MDDRLARLLDATPIGFEVPPGGHTRSKRGVVALESGEVVFVKVGSDERTAAALRTEHQLYSSVGADWLPQVLAWEDGREPILVLEDLSAARWPPPWPDDLTPLLETLRCVAETNPPFEVESMAPLETCPWTAIAEEPGPIAALGVIDQQWIVDHAPTLTELTSTIDLTGPDLVHADLGAENLCFTPRGPVIVDWEFISRGNRFLDVATVLLDYRIAGGTPPLDALPNRAAWATLLGGFMGVHASRPPPQWAADGLRLRTLQREAFAAAIDWILDELGM